MSKVLINKIELIHADITQLKVDAIVNAANNSLMGGGGVDGAIHRAAGKQLLEECRTLNGAKTGEAKITKGYNLYAKFIIHAVGPVWYGGHKNEDELLKNCYLNSLKLAVENNIRTIVFPSISTGAYRFPFDRAAKIAYTTISDFLKANKEIEKVFLVVFSEKDRYQFEKIIEQQ